MRRRCVICHCTERRPCCVKTARGTRPCGWREEDLCDNPECVRLAGENALLCRGEQILKRAAAHLMQTRGRFRGMNEREGCPEFEFTSGIYDQDDAWLPWMLLKAKGREVRLLHSESIAVAVAIRRESKRRARSVRVKFEPLTDAQFLVWLVLLANFAIVWAVTLNVADRLVREWRDKERVAQEEEEDREP